MPRVLSTSKRLDGDRIVSMVSRLDNGEHLLRFRNGERSTEIALSREAMIAVVELFFVIHENDLQLVADAALACTNEMEAKP